MYGLDRVRLASEADLIPLPRGSYYREKWSITTKKANPNLQAVHLEYMAKKSKKKKASNEDPNQKVVSENRKARHKYSVLDTLECGIVLHGSEVKSLRNGHVSLDESYARVKKGEVWLIGCDIQEYFEANRMNHDARRQRKLLLHRIQIRKFADQAQEKGLSLIPLKVYFKDGKAKVLLGLCKGKQLHDKRESLKKADSQRDIQREMRKRNRR